MLKAIRFCLQYYPIQRSNQVIDYKEHTYLDKLKELQNKGLQLQIWLR